MHIEKNIGDIIIGTLLNMKRKAKDGLKARKDLKDMGIRKALHPENDMVGSNNSKAPFILSKKEKKLFCKRLATLRLPFGYFSNLASRVSLQECKIFGLKSHDYHVLVQQVLLAMLRGLLKKGPRIAIFRLCAFLNEVCQRVLDINKLEQLENDIAETLCMFERFFPPSFFNISLHLVIHLGQEARIGGPVQFRWMYQFERFMKVLKRYTKNHSNSEGCMAEKSLATESAEFCSGYMKQPAELCVEWSRDKECKDEQKQEGRPIGQGKFKTISSSMLVIAHLYVLENTPEVEPYRKMHLEELKCSNIRLLKNESLLMKKHKETFSRWLAKKVRMSDSSNIPDIVHWLGCGPGKDAKCYFGYTINGYRFHTRDAKTNTQNSGISVQAETLSRSSAKDTSPVLGNISYFGVLKDIILLDYRKFSVPIFQCDWANIASGVKFEDGLTLVNLHQGKRQFENDPFILASQAIQVFYSRDDDTSNWYVVLKAPPRGFYESENVEDNIYMPSVLVDVSQLNLNDEDYVLCEEEPNLSDEEDD